MDKDDKVLQISTPRNGILQLTLNRSSALNALNHELMVQLASAIDTARKDETVKALLITGNGRAFCSGADIPELAALTGPTGLQFARHGQKVFRSLETLGKPSVAAVQGPAMGGGMELAMSATIRFASNKAVFAQPEIKLGVIPGFGGTQRLSRLVGRGRAMAWCLTGQKIHADEAKAAGLVSEVIAEDQLMECALDCLSNLTQFAPIALQSIMRVIYQGHDLSMEDALELEAAHFALCCGTQDKQEGVNAFINKRQAIFCGV